MSKASMDGLTRRRRQFGDDAGLGGVEPPLLAEVAALDAEDERVGSAPSFEDESGTVPLRRDAFADAPAAEVADPGLSLLPDLAVMGFKPIEDSSSAGLPVEVEVPAGLVVRLRMDSRFGRAPLEGGTAVAAESDVRCKPCFFGERVRPLEALALREAVADFDGGSIEADARPFP